MVCLYEKKPVRVYAIQYTPYNYMHVLNFCGDNAVFTEWGEMYIKTLEGNMKANINDYIIRGVNGEFYPCKEDIFNKTYIKV